METATIGAVQPSCRVSTHGCPHTAAAHILQASLKAVTSLLLLYVPIILIRNPTAVRTCPLPVGSGVSAPIANPLGSSDCDKNCLTPRGLLEGGSGV